MKQTPITHNDWMDHFTERVAIMEESGMEMNLAAKSAWDDTTAAHGPCPAPGLT